MHNNMKLVIFFRILFFRLGPFSVNASSTLSLHLMRKGQYVKIECSRFDLQCFVELFRVSRSCHWIRSSIFPFSKGKWEYINLSGSARK